MAQGMEKDDPSHPISIHSAMGYRCIWELMQNIIV